MKKVIINLAVVALSLSFVTTAQAQLKFKDYPVKVYKGKKATLKVWAGGNRGEVAVPRPSVDFAGLYHHQVQFGGVGMPWDAFFGVRTGKQYDFSEEISLNRFVKCSDGSEGDIAFKRNSRLLIVKGTTETEFAGADNVKCEVRYFVEKNGKLIRIK